MVISNNETVPVTNINGKWHLFEKARRQFEGLFLVRVSQIYGDASAISDRVRRDRGFAGLRRKERNVSEGTLLIVRHPGIAAPPHA